MSALAHTDQLSERYRTTQVIDYENQIIDVAGMDSGGKDHLFRAIDGDRRLLPPMKLHLFRMLSRKLCESTYALRSYR